MLSRFGTAGRWLAYATHGRLNEAGNNCVLLPSYYAGTHKSYEQMIGPGRALDPASWFIVVVNMMGNGVSSSPSNDVDFRDATIADNVRLQHGMLVSLGVKRLALIYGWSMGAMQGFAWATMFSEMVAALLTVCGTARCWPLNHVFLEGAKAALVNAASAEAGKQAFGRVYAGWAYSAAFFRDELYRGMGFENREALLRFWEEDHLGWDARDLLTMLATWQQAGMDAAALGRVTARTIVMPCDTDAYFTLEEARIEAASLPSGELRVLRSPYGHCAGAPGRFLAETTFVETALRDLLHG